MLSGNHGVAPFFSHMARPRGLVGHAWEIPTSAAIALVVTVTFGLELLTPRDVLATLALVPLLIAVWTLSTWWVVAVTSVAAGQFAIAVAVEAGSRPTLVIVGVVGLCILLLARGYAVSDLHVPPSQRTLTPTQINRLIPKSAPAGGSVRGIGALSQREFEVARLASRGHTASDIGRMLHIGARTVETHIAHAYAKLHIQSKAQLIRMCDDLERRA